MTSVATNGDARALQGRRAGFVTRATADVIDVIVVVVAWYGGVLFAGLLRFMFRPRRGLHVPQIPSGVALACVAVLAIAYLTVFVATTGRTFGKRFCGLRVTSASGKPVGSARALLRATISVVFPAGFLWVLVSERNRSVADILASTAVVYDWGLTTVVPPVGAPIPAKRPV